jgi:ABC-type branched-subunit amino acid transport system substrate-binding protein
MSVMSDVFPFTGFNSPSMQEYVAAFRAEHQQTSPASAQGWAAAKLFEKVLQGAGPNVSSASLLTQLYGLHRETLGGLTAPITFRRGHGAPDFGCFFALGIQNDRYVAPRGDKAICR